MKDHWTLFAGYDAWANARLHAAVLAAPGGTFHRDGGASFGTLRYRRLAAPESVEQPLGSALAHMFNHHARHRGRAHALLTRFGGPEAGPALDLLAYQREIGAAG